MIKYKWHEVKRILIAQRMSYRNAFDRTSFTYPDKNLLSMKNFFPDLVELRLLMGVELSFRGVKITTGVGLELRFGGVKITISPKFQDLQI